MSYYFLDIDYRSSSNSDEATVKNNWHDFCFNVVLLSESFNKWYQKGKFLKKRKKKTANAYMASLKRLSVCWKIVYKPGDKKSEKLFPKPIYLTVLRKIKKIIIAKVKFLELTLKKTLLKKNSLSSSYHSFQQIVSLIA